jgi:formylglycine-generating enzyme required for sulfatase activity
MATLYTKIPRAVLWLIRGSDFDVGGAGGDTEPAHSVELGSFYISRGPISNEQFEAFMPGFSRDPTSPGNDDPAVGVSFIDASAYAAWYAELSSKAFRLPTEAEWEYAASAVGKHTYPWGDDPAPGVRFAWTKENGQGVCHPVDTPTPGKTGLYGMIGNVWEWTSSAYRAYPIVAGDGRDDATGDEPRVIRGGSHTQSIAELSCTRREAKDPDTRSPVIGFRIVRGL